MRASRRFSLFALAVALAFGGYAAMARKAATAPPAYASFRIDAAAAKRDHVPVLPAATRAATFSFAAGTSPGDKAAFLAAVADARPPARRLIDLVDGLVDVRIAPTGEGNAIGLTQPTRDRYVVTVDFARVATHYGRRGIDRVVLHELGHVVDFALIPDDVRHTLDAGIPIGYGCEGGVSGACANARERFAESFAKWATGDIGLDLYVGYQVLPPAPTLQAWGAPLAALGR
jgi:hypothetical protein